MCKSAIALGLGLALVLLGGCRDDAAPAAGPTIAGSGSGVQHVEQALAQIVATASETVGTIEVRRRGQVNWEPVVVGTTLRERDWVRTGPRSFGRLRFASKGFIDLTEDTTVLVDSAITVEAGSVAGVTEGDQPLVVRAADGSEAQLVATAGSGPVEFQITPTAAKGLEIAVTKGNLKLVTKAGEQTIGAGEASDLAQNRTSAAVKRIAFPKILSPGVDARFLFTETLRIPLTWASVPGAQHYRVQIARNNDFHSLVMTLETATTGSSFSPDAEGIYTWRVAARDAAGRLGEFGFARRIYCEKDEPRDLLVGPRDGFKIDFPNTPPKVEFSWRPSGDAKKYRLVIHRAGPGTTPVVTETTTAQQLEVTLPEGSYLWGVYSLGEDRVDPIFLSLRQLTIRKQLGPKIKTEVEWNK